MEEDTKLGFKGTAKYSLPNGNGYYLCHLGEGCLLKDIPLLKMRSHVKGEREMVYPCVCVFVRMEGKTKREIEEIKN